MATSISASSPPIPPFLLLSPRNNSPPLLRLHSSLHHLCRRPHIVCSINTGGWSACAEEERKREVLERYGLDLADFGSKSSKRGRRRRKDEEKGRKGRQAPVVPETPKPPRTTHKLLHVLGGKARRKKLLSPKGMDVRPMMELVRGAAFDILQAAGGCPASLRPGRWLDLYSGTGSVGIEALSWGCSEAHFVEMDPWVVSEVLRPNLEWTGFLDVTVIHMTRVESFLQHAEQSFGGDGSFDYVCVTPPYTAVDYNTLMDQLEKSPLLGKDTFVIADRRFGRTHLAIYGPTWAQKKKRSKTSLLMLGRKAPVNVESVV